MMSAFMQALFCRMSIVSYIIRNAILVFKEHNYFSLSSTEVTRITGMSYILCNHIL